MTDGSSRRSVARTRERGKQRIYSSCPAEPYRRGIIVAPLKILIAEDQYLIAMELERILKEICDCAVSFCSSAGLTEGLHAQQHDIAIVDAASSPAEYRRQGQMVRQSGAGLVFLSAYPRMLEATADLGHLAVFEKPFDEFAIRRVFQALYPKLGRTGGEGAGSGPINPPDSGE